jgi:extradiol dioxygenase family protein
VIIETDDCRGTYERLREADVEFTQEPTERFYGTDCALRDPFGNPIRFTEPPNGRVTVPSPEEAQAQL